MYIMNVVEVFVYIHQVLMKTYIVMYISEMCWQRQKSTEDKNSRSHHVLKCVNITTYYVI